MLAKASNNIQRMHPLSSHATFIHEIFFATALPKTTWHPDSHFISIYFISSRICEFSIPTVWNISAGQRYLLAARTNGINDRNNILRGRGKAHTFQSTSKKYYTWLSTHSLSSMCSTTRKVFPTFWGMCASLSFSFFFPSFPKQTRSKTFSFFLSFFFFRRQRGRFINERGNTAVNSVGRSGRSNWTRRKVGQKGWEASKLQSSTIVLCNLPLVASCSGRMS